MIKAVKVRLLPTKEQEILMFKSTGVARFAYNWGLAAWEEMYNQNQKPSKAKIRKYTNPRCHFDGKYWYLTFGFEHGENKTELNQNLSIGIDLGVSDLATISCLENPIKNINKTQKVRKLKKRLKRLQRQVSRKYEANKDGNKFVKTNNIIKLEKQIKLLYRKLSNIRDNHIHQTTASVIKLKPYRVVMEDLKLKDRVYKCEKCNLIIDRDKNASINLGNYKIV